MKYFIPTILFFLVVGLGISTYKTGQEELLTEEQIVSLVGEKMHWLLSDENGQLCNVRFKSREIFIIREAPDPYSQDKKNWLRPANSNNIFLIYDRQEGPHLTASQKSELLEALENWEISYDSTHFLYSITPLLKI